VAQLSRTDRLAVVLRFYRELDFDAIGKTLGISTDAAKKRVSRALARLRRHLGADVSAEALTAAAAFGAHANPAALSAHVNQTALSTASGATPGSIAYALKGAGFLMATTKLKIAVVAIILAMSAGITVAVWQLVTAPADTQVSAPQAPAAPRPTPMVDSTQSFESIYGLRGNEAVRLVPLPFAPARLDFFRKQYPQQAAANPSGPGAMILQWQNGTPQAAVETFGNGGSAPLRTIDLFRISCTSIHRMCLQTPNSPEPLGNPYPATLS